MSSGRQLRSSSSRQGLCATSDATFAQDSDCCSIAILADATPKSFDGCRCGACVAGRVRSVYDGWMTAGRWPSCFEDQFLHSRGSIPALADCQSITTSPAAGSPNTSVDSESRILSRRSRLRRRRRVQELILDRSPPLRVLRYAFLLAPSMPLGAPVPPDGSGPSKLIESFQTSEALPKSCVGVALGVRSTGRLLMVAKRETARVVLPSPRRPLRGRASRRSGEAATDGQATVAAARPGASNAIGAVR